MLKTQSRRHSWEREGEWATCTNCGLKVETRRIKKGGLPNCEDVLEAKSQEVIEPECEDVIEAKSQEVIEPEKPKSVIAKYISYYHKGTERYGVWWKFFTFSMLTVAAVFLTTAIILFIIYG